MTTREITVLVNPRSGRGKAIATGARAVQHLQEVGLKVEVLTGTDGEDSQRLAHEAVKSGTDALVVAGGDGMVHLGLQAVAKTDTPLGIIPCGGGNDIARALDIPLRDPLAAADLVSRQQVRQFDLGRSGDRWFGGVVAMGFDSRVNDRANRMKLLHGRLRYDAAIVAELGVFKPVPYEITVDGERWVTEGMLVAVANAPSYGGGMRVVPDADMSDGLLDVLVVKPISKAKFLTVFPRVYRGTHVKLPEVEIRRGRTIEVSAPDITAYVDGEKLGPLPRSYTAMPAAARVFAPNP